MPSLDRHAAAFRAVRTLLAAHGLSGDRLETWKDGSNLLVRPVPAPVILRVATFTGRIRRDPMPLPRARGRARDLARVARRPGDGARRRDAAGPVPRRRVGDRGVALRRPPAGVVAGPGRDARGARGPASGAARLPGRAAGLRPGRGRPRPRVRLCAEAGHHDATAVDFAARPPRHTLGAPAQARSRARAAARRRVPAQHGRRPGGPRDVDRPRGRLSRVAGVGPRGARPAHRRCVRSGRRPRRGSAGRCWTRRSRCATSRARCGTRSTTRGWRAAGELAASYAVPAIARTPRPGILRAEMHYRHYACSCPCRPARLEGVGCMRARTA